jgi:hypothetical protein
MGMGQFLRDQRLHNLNIDDAALAALNDAFVARAAAGNALAQNVAQQAIPFYVIRFDEKGYRFTNFADVQQHYTDAKKVERVIFTMDSGDNRQSGGLFGTFFELRLDAKEVNNCYLSVTSDNRQWVDATFAAITDVLSRQRSKGSAVVRTQWAAAAIQMLGVCVGFLFSLWAAVVIAPRLAIDNAFAVSLIFAFLIFSNIWGYLLTQIARLLDATFPNVGFIRKDKEGKGNWFIRGVIIGLIFVPISLLLLKQLLDLAVLMLNTFVK